MAKRSREDSPSAKGTDTPSSASFASRSPSPSSVKPVPSTQADASRSTKYIQISEEQNGDSVVMKCSLAPHPEAVSFTSFEDFEVHYAQIHTNRCSECHKNFPTSHFLDLHISENHDPMVQARKAKDEKTYRCFVEGCDKVCSAPHKRKMHLQAKHYFPRDYDFFIVNDGIDKRSSMLRTRHRRGSSAATRALQRNPKPGSLNHKQPSPPEHIRDRANSHMKHQGSSSNDHSEEAPLQPSPISEPAGADSMDDLTSTMSALRFVPSSVRFGRGGRKAGLSRR
ncbi:MAG: hypothetical protein Q9174_004591 [Haloplaca sp. 1 TL-2023]